MKRAGKRLYDWLDSKIMADKKLVLYSLYEITSPPLWQPRRGYLYLI